MEIETLKLINWYACGFFILSIGFLLGRYIFPKNNKEDNDGGEE